MSNTLLELNGLYDGLNNHLIRLNAGVAQYDNLRNWETKNFGPGTPAALIGETATAATIPGTAIPLWILDGRLTDVSNTPSVFIATNKRHAWYVAAQDEWQLAPDWTFTGGARYDKFSDFGATFNPRAALVWATNYNLTSKLLLGSAFRAPSFTEQYIKNNPVTQGNPALQPEKVHTVELAFEYRPDNKWRHHANVFYYQARDLIDYDQQRVSQNLRKQTGSGLELESSWQLSPSLQLSGSYAWQNAQDKTNNNAVPDAPGSELSASVMWRPGDNWTLYSGLNHIHKRHRASGDTRPAVDNYTLVNLKVAKELSRNLELSMLVRNLFNEAAKEPSLASASYIAEDYPLEGRNGLIELRYKMGQ